MLAAAGFFVLRGRTGQPAAPVALPSEEPVATPAPESLPPDVAPIEQPVAMVADTTAVAEQDSVAQAVAPAPEPVPEPPSGFALTRPTVVISDLAVENVVDIAPDSGGGYQVAQRLESGERVYVTVVPRGGPADTLLAGQITVGSLDDGAVGQTVFSDFFVTVHGPVAVVVVESLLRRLTVALPPEERREK